MSSKKEESLAKTQTSPVLHFIEKDNHLPAKEKPDPFLRPTFQ
jgi:hypothetical protein